ncbi:hypothetical protein HanPI659440_Chr15g0614471 [Helianthus annuus]|nr:hypothetical protein HanPI659440_Chr15g0614471 [Helianthus annuus]
MMIYMGFNASRYYMFVLSHPRSSRDLRLVYIYKHQKSEIKTNERSRMKEINTVFPSFIK